MINSHDVMIVNEKSYGIIRLHIDEGSDPNLVILSLFTDNHLVPDFNTLDSALVIENACKI